MPCVQAHVACADLSSRRQPCARAGARLRALLRYCGPKTRKRACSGTGRSVGLHFLASRGADCSIEHRAPCVAARQPMPFQMASPSSQCSAAGSRARAWELLGCCRPAKSRRHRLSRPAFSGLAGPSQEERPPTRMHARPHLCAFVRLDTCMLARTPHSLAQCTHAHTHAHTSGSGEDGSRHGFVVLLVLTTRLWGMAACFAIGGSVSGVFRGVSDDAVHSGWCGYPFSGRYQALCAQV